MGSEHAVKTDDVGGLMDCDSSEDRSPCGHETVHIELLSRSASGQNIGSVVIFSSHKVFGRANDTHGDRESDGCRDSHFLRAVSFLSSIAVSH